MLFVTPLTTFKQLGKDYAHLVYVCREKDVPLRIQTANYDVQTTQAHLEAVATYMGTSALSVVDILVKQHIKQAIKDYMQGYDAGQGEAEYNDAVSEILCRVDEPEQKQALEALLTE